MLATALGDKEIVKMLLVNGANKNIEDIQNYTALSYARDLDYKEIIQLLQ